MIDTADPAQYHPHTCGATPDKIEAKKMPLLDFGSLGMTFCCGLPFTSVQSTRVPFASIVQGNNIPNTSRQFDNPPWLQTHQQKTKTVQRTFLSRPQCRIVWLTPERPSQNVALVGTVGRPPREQKNCDETDGRNEANKT